MDSGYNPQTVEEVFRDFKGRRAGIIRALTTGMRPIREWIDSLFLPNDESSRMEFEFICHVCEGFGWCRDLF